MSLLEENAFCMTESQTLRSGNEEFPMNNNFFGKMPVDLLFDSASSQETSSIY
jgi:hypothetical protein